MIELDIAPITSPIGPMAVVASEGILLSIAFGEEPRDAGLARRLGPVTLRRRRDPAGVVSRLRAYFAGDLAALDGIPVDPGGTDFQRRVWDTIRRIPAGATATYREVAKLLGNADACRAVGLANHCNPIPIVIPCHRVIGARGHLTGYAGGIEVKRWLLEHEGALLPLSDAEANPEPRSPRALGA